MEEGRRGEKAPRRVWDYRYAMHATRGMGVRGAHVHIVGGGIEGGCRKPAVAAAGWDRLGVEHLRVDTLGVSYF